MQELVLQVAWQLRQNWVKHPTHKCDTKQCGYPSLAMACVKKKVAERLKSLPRCQ